MAYAGELGQLSHLLLASLSLVSCGSKFLLYAGGSLLFVHTIATRIIAIERQSPCTFLLSYVPRFKKFKSHLAEVVRYSACSHVETACNGFLTADVLCSNHIPPHLELGFQATLQVGSCRKPLCSPKGKAWEVRLQPSRP